MSENQPNASKVLPVLLWVADKWKYVAILGLAGTILLWIVQDWSKQRADSQKAFSESLREVQKAESQFAERGQPLFDVASGGEIFSRDIALALLEATRELQEAVRDADAPTRALERQEARYRRELAELSGALLAYEQTVEGLERVLNEAVDVDAAAFGYREAGSRFLNSTFRSFLGTI